MLQTLEFKGSRLAYRITGTGPPLVMIQGVGAYGTSPNPLIDILERSFTCLNFDNRGSGASQPAAVPLSADQMAADVLALMDAAGWPSAHFVGHSLGGLVALEVATQVQDRVRSLSLLCSFPSGAHASHLTPRVLWILFRLRFGAISVRRRAFLELVLPSHRWNDAYLADRISKIIGHDIGELPDIVNEQVAAMRSHDVTAQLPQLRGIPTLVINGDEDLIAPPSAGRAIANGIPGAKFVEIPHAGHSFPILEPERCAALILDHLNQAEQRQ